MIRWLVIAAALVVAACDDPAPAEPVAPPRVEAPQPSEPPMPIVETVLPSVKPTPPVRPLRRPGKFAACDRYDEDMEQAVARWWLGRPHWSWWKAQIWQESRCNPTARSPVGAEGLAQVMPATWSDMMKLFGEDPLAIPRTHARMSIAAGARYMRVLKDQWQRWSANEDLMQTHFHAAAGYNAGSANILKAWRACGRPTAWDETVTCLQQITGRHSAETIGYLANIRRWQGDLLP